MPLREYKCLECNAKFETLVSSGKEKELQECPYCGKLLSELLPAVLGGYSIRGVNSASTKPVGGAFKRGSK